MDRLERLVNLVAALIDTDHPLTRAQIHRRIEGYSDDTDAFRRNFERDKELLRQMGLPLSTEALDPNHPDELGYRIRREDYELPDPGLNEDELAALRLASAAVQVEGAWGQAATIRALRKLGGAVPHAGGPATRSPVSNGAGLTDAAEDTAAEGTAAEGAPGARLAALPGGEVVAAAFGAVAERRRVRFPYRGQERLVEPWRLSFRRGQWYLAGRDCSRDAERLFRLDRVEGAMTTEGPAGAFARPQGVDSEPPPAWRLGDEEEVLAQLLVDADQARWAVETLGEAAVAERRPDGSVVFEVEVTNPRAFRSFVLGFLDHAEVLGPPALRADVVAWLTAVEDAAAGPATAGPATAGPATAGPARA